MIEPLDAVHEGDVARHIEAHVDDVALGGRDDDALDPLLMLVVARVAADDLHLCAGKGEIERSRIGDIGEQEANHLATPRHEAPIWPPPFTRNTLPKRPIKACVV